jgi:hypothetical protein
MATFRARLPGPGVRWIDEHLLVVGGAPPHPGGSRAIVCGGGNIRLARLMALVAPRRRADGETDAG